MNGLREKRSNANLTMKEVAEKIGVSEGAISLYESGKREPDFTKLKKLAELFKCSVDELL